MMVWKRLPVPAETLSIRIPPGPLEACRLGGDILAAPIDGPTHNDDVALALANDLLRCAVLLAVRIARGIRLQRHPRRHGDKVGVVHEPLHAYKTNHKVAVLSSPLDRGACVVSAGQVALRAHLGQ